MSFTPFARYRNFTLANLKALLEVYPDMARSIPWEEVKNFAEANLKGYKRTAYQQACQLGLEDRTKDSFRIHNYLYTFDDENLTKYLVFWFKTYFAPNPHVKSSDEAFLLYCRLCEDILQSESHSVNFEDFVEKNIGGKSDDILLNAIKAYAAPVKYRKVGNYDNLYISESDINAIEDEVRFIKANFPIGNPKSEHNFFERFSYANFCKFYGKDENPEVKDGEEIRLADTSRVELHFEQSKECARHLVDCVYRIDNFERFSKVLKNNDKNVKIITDDLGGNYLRYMFAKSTSDLVDIGITDFTIEKYSEDNALYRLRREGSRGNVFKTLSEGEKMVISFLYFIELCKGETTVDSSATGKIVVIDDPISSLSHIYVFNIGRLIHNEFLRTNKYEQIFVLTHSLYFFYELTNTNHKEREETQKLIRLCKNAEGSAFVSMKYEEIQNDYQAYWHIIKDRTQAPALIANCMRNIIEYFFNFVEKLDFPQVFQKPELQDTRFLAFNRYMNRESHSKGQNIFDIKEFDYDSFRDAFKLVFEIEGYPEHYQKMMK